jgi:hypothetical protein
MSSQNSKIALLSLFKDKLIEFIDALIELLPNEGDLILLKIMFQTQIPLEQAMQIFSSRIMPYADMVEAKDERFFLETTDLFAGIRRDKVSYFKDIWQSKEMTNEDRDALWQWFNFFLKLAKRYTALSSPSQ